MHAIVELAVYGVLATLLTVGGIVVELTSLQYVTGGDVMVAGWLAVMGAILLYAGVYLTGYERLAPLVGKQL